MRNVQPTYTRKGNTVEDFISTLDAEFSYLRGHSFKGIFLSKASGVISWLVGVSGLDVGRLRDLCIGTDATYTVVDGEVARALGSNLNLLFRILDGLDEPLPKTIQNELKQAVKPNVEKLVELYVGSKERALDYARAIEIFQSEFLFTLGYLAQNGELPPEVRPVEADVAEATADPATTVDTPAGAGAEIVREDVVDADLAAEVREIEIAIDPEFARHCYTLISEGSAYYQAAQLQLGQLIINELEGKTGEARETLLQSLMAAAIASKDMEFIGVAFTLCAGTMPKEELRASSMPDLLYKIAVSQRSGSAVAGAGAAGGASASSMVTPVRATTASAAAGGAGEPTSGR